jgi:uncharacterized protein YcbX
MAERHERPVDPARAARRSKSKQPLRTLAGYRRRDNDVWFGMNLIGDDTGRLAAGDALTL